MLVGSEREMRLRPSGRDGKLSRKKKIIKRRGGNIRKRGNRVCRRREQRELKGSRIQNSFSVIEQMFELRTSGTRESVFGRTVFSSFFFFSLSLVFEAYCSVSGCPSHSLADAGGLLFQTV